MLSQIKNTIKEIEDSKDFKDWYSQNKQSYLCSVFLISESLEELSTGWQIDYYNPKDDKITSFIMVGDSLQVIPPEEVFKKDKTKVKELSIDKIKIDLDEAFNLTKKLVKDKYKNENPEKIIIILQSLDETVWNITYLTSAFNVINIKINAINGKAVSDSITSILNFKQK